MNKKSLKQRSLILLVVLVMALIPVLSACGGNDDSSNKVNDGENIQNDATAGEEEPEFEYEFPSVNYNGGVFKILNVEPIWDFTTTIVPEELAGEQLNDAIFNRNMLISDKFNVELEEVLVHMDSIEQRIKTSINSGVHDYDAMYCPGNNSSTIGSLVQQGNLVDLATLPELNLTSPWWNQDILEDSKIGSENAVYFASNDVLIMTLQGAWVTYFNEDMLQNLGLEKPYQLARDGKWTLDQLATYMKAAVNINSDESFSPFNVMGTSVYGMASYEAGVAGLLLGSDARIIGRDKDGNPSFVAGEPRFIDACQKIADILAEPGMYVNINDTKAPNAANYEIQFMANRALFAQAEIKSCTVFREMESNFGILPTPKFNESQERYANIIFRQAPLFILPVTNQDLSKAAIIMDALSFVSYRDVTPIFFDVSVSQKGLRNEESIEMLNIIRGSSVFDIGRIYNWANTLDEAIRTALAKGDGNVVSTIERNVNQINAAIEKTLDQIDK